MEKINLSSKNIGIWLIWLALGLGITYTLRFAGKQYQMSIVEPMLLLSVIAMILRGRIKVPPRIPLIIFFSFFMWSLLGVFGARDQMEALALVLSIFYGIITFIIAYDFFEGNPEAYFRGLRLFSVLVSVQVIWAAGTVLFAGDLNVILIVV